MLKQIGLTLKLQNQNLVLEIEDDGIGHSKAMENLQKQDKDQKSMATEITRQRISAINKKQKKENHAGNP